MSPSNCRSYVAQGCYRGRMIYRPKVASNHVGSTSDAAVQQSVAGTREPDLAPDFPPWVENLLSIAAYNFPAGLVFFCVSCSKGRLFQERHFEPDADHHGHDRLRIYNLESSPGVSQADMESLGLDTTQIQAIRRSNIQGSDSALFIFIHGTAGYADKQNSSEPWKNCARASCRTRLHHVQEWINCSIRFCSLDCKVHFLKDLEGARRNIRSRVAGPPSPPPPPLPPLPDYRTYLSHMTFAEITKGRKGSSSTSQHQANNAEVPSTTTNGDIVEHLDLDVDLGEYMALLTFHSHESDLPFVQLGSPNAGEKNEILRLPEVFYKDQLHVLFSSTDTSYPTPPVSPSRSPEVGQFSGCLNSCAISNTVESPDPIGLGPECTLFDGTAASRLVWSAPQLKDWRTWSPDALSLTRKSLDDNNIERSGFSSSLFRQPIRNLHL